ncbi:hypothetical protein EDC01DRAFT_630729 [Geopyxis carbonaria]|nr:hypothetical protein EDC01DRAFT_630729 [Geopyxis carbonaria]
MDLNRLQDLEQPQLAASDPAIMVVEARTEPRRMVKRSGSPLRGTLKRRRTSFGLSGDDNPEIPADQEGLHTHVGKLSGRGTPNSSSQDELDIMTKRTTTVNDNLESIEEQVKAKLAELSSLESSRLALVAEIKSGQRVVAAQKDLARKMHEYCQTMQARCQEQLEIQKRKESLAAEQQKQRDADLSLRERRWNARYTHLVKREKVVAAAEARLTAHAKKWAKTRSFQVEGVEGPGPRERISDSQLRRDAKQKKQDRDLNVTKARLSQSDKKLSAKDPDVPDEIGSGDDSGRDSVDRFFLREIERDCYNIILRTMGRVQCHNVAWQPVTGLCVCRFTIALRQECIPYSELLEVQVSVEHILLDLDPNNTTTREDLKAKHSLRDKEEQIKDEQADLSILDYRRRPVSLTIKTLERSVQSLQLEADGLSEHCRRMRVLNQDILREQWQRQFLATQRQQARETELDTRENAIARALHRREQAIVAAEERLRMREQGMLDDQQYGGADWSPREHEIAQAEAQVIEQAMKFNWGNRDKFNQLVFMIAISDVKVRSIDVAMQTRNIGCRVH